MREALLALRVVFTAHEPPLQVLQAAAPRAVRRSGQRLPGSVQRRLVPGGVGGGTQQPRGRRTGPHGEKHCAGVSLSHGEWEMDGE